MMLTADEIRWTPNVLPTSDRMVASDEDLIVDAVSDAIGYRTLALVAISQLTDLRRTLAVRDRTIAAQRDELRRYLRAQLAEAAA